MAAFGRKQTFDFADIPSFERLLWGKADIPVLDLNFLQSTGYLTSALPPEAAVGVISGK